MGSFWLLEGHSVEKKKSAEIQQKSPNFGFTGQDRIFFPPAGFDLFINILLF